MSPVALWTVLKVSYALSLPQITLILSGYVYGMSILVVTLAGSLAGAVTVFSIARTFGVRDLSTVCAYSGLRHGANDG